MHVISPVPFGNIWVVDIFLGNVSLVSHIIANAQQILDQENSNHGLAVQVLINDSKTVSAWYVFLIHRMHSTELLTHVFNGNFLVQPPASDSWAIVSGWSAYSHPFVILASPEVVLWIGRHALNAET